MIVLEQGLNGYDDGLNGLKIAKMLKKVTLKGAIKVVKNIAPLAISMIPVVGGPASSIVGKILQKVTTNKDGSASLVGRIAEGVNKDGSQSFIGRAAESVKVMANSEVGKVVTTNFAPLVKNAKAALLAKTGIIPTDAQLETLAEAKGTTPQQELDNIVASAPESVVAAAMATTTPAKDNTMLYIGGGVIGAGVLYAIFK